MQEHATYTAFLSSSVSLLVPFPRYINWKVRRQMAIIQNTNWFSTWLPASKRSGIGAGNMVIGSSNVSLLLLYLTVHFLNIWFAWQRTWICAQSLISGGITQQGSSLCPLPSLNWQRNWHSGRHTRSNSFYALLFLHTARGRLRGEGKAGKLCTVSRISFPHLLLMFVFVSVLLLALTRQLITDTTYHPRCPATPTTSTSLFPQFTFSCSFWLVFQFPPYTTVSNISLDFCKLQQLLEMMFVFIAVRALCAH